MFSLKSVTVLRAHTFSGRQCANADAFGVYVQDFEGVAVEDGNDGAGDAIGKS
jgi:hypothetical protein